MAASTQSIIHSTGRGQVTQPQVPVVVTYDAHWEAYNRRTKQSELRAPTWHIGAPTDYAMLLGELAFQYDNNVDGMKSYVAQYNVQKAFTSFNGLHYNDHISFAGVVDKEYDSSKPSGDTAVTLRRCGTHTIINTGGQTIAQGHLVMWDYPLVVKFANNTMRARVEIPGLPKTKILPSLRTLRMQDIFALFAEAEGRAIAILTDITIADHEKMGAMQTWLDTKADNGGCSGVDSNSIDVIDGDLQKSQNRRSPLRRYMGWLAATHNIANDWWNLYEGENFAFLDPVEDGKIALTGQAAKPILKKRKATNTNAALIIKEAKSNSLSVVACVCEQYRLMASRCIGTALSTAAAGQKFDILLGYFAR